jgi:type VI secretion system protein ImpK
MATSRVNDVTDDIFNVLGQIRRAPERAYGQPDALYRELRSIVEQAMRRALELGYAQADAQDMGYVLAALVDEVVLSKGGKLREFWLSRLLQMHFFNENTAGEGVFDRLQLLLRDPSRVDVLRVYYVALLFGFKGKYAVRGAEVELADVTDGVAEALRRAGRMEEVALSPHGARTGDVRSAVKRNMPIVALGGIALALSLVVIFGLRCSIGGHAGDVVEQVEQATETLRAERAQ